MPTVPTLPTRRVVPDVALIGVPGQAAVDAVAAAAEMGVKGVVVMSSGFGETGTAEGLRMQEELLGHARRAGMRVVGPNSQGLASFHSGAVLGFSTLFTEEPPADGPVGIISQSGALASVPYGILRRRGIGVRYAHGTGNDLDVTCGRARGGRRRRRRTSGCCCSTWRTSATRSRWSRSVSARAERRRPGRRPGGRPQPASGSRAAASHTGALATERRVLDAFFERVGIWQVHSVRELVAASELYLQDWAAAR